MESRKLISSHISRGLQGLLALPRQPQNYNGFLGCLALPPKAVGRDSRGEVRASSSISLTNKRSTRCVSDLYLSHPAMNTSLYNQSYWLVDD